MLSARNQDLKSSVFACLFASVLGCGGTILPDLPGPNQAEVLPTVLQIRVSDPDLEFDQAWQVPNETQWVELEVLVMGGSVGAAETALPDETVNFTFENARQAATRVLGLDQGSSCSTDDTGRCRLAIRLGTEPGDWVIRAAALRNAQAFAEQHMVIGIGDRRRVKIEAPGLPVRNWNGSLPDPWLRDELILARSEAEGAPFKLTVYDQHDNPVPGARIILLVRGVGAPSGAVADAGPPADTEAPMLDANQFDVAQPRDGGFGDAAVRDAASAVDPTGCSLAACLGGESSERVLGVTDDDGHFATQLVPGASSGRFALEVRIEETGDDAYPFPSVALNGKTYQRLASQIVFDGRAVCFPADSLRGARVRVLDSTGAGVANSSLQILAEGLFGASAPPTDDEGWAELTARCPSQPPGINEVLLLRAIVVDQPGVQIDIPVAFETAAPDRVDYVPIRFDANSITAGSVSRLRFRVTDRNGFPVPEASVTAQPLSDADLGRLTFRSGEGFVSTQTLETNLVGEVIFEVRPVGARTQPEYPLQLKVFASLDPVVHALLPVHVMGGTPQRVQVVRGQNMQLLTGQGGAVVTVRVDDGQDNPISNVVVTLQPPPSVVMAPVQGRTDTRGEFSAGVLEVRGFEDDQTVRVPVSARWFDSEGVEWTEAAEVLLRLGVGSAQGVAFEQAGEALAECEGLPCLKAPVGQLLETPLEVQVVNANGGPLAQQPVAINLVDDQPQGCGSRPGEGADLGTTGERGALDVGGDVGAAWRLGDQARDCLWEVVSGQVTQRLVVRQQPGLPSLGTFQAYDGDGALFGLPSATLELAARPFNFRRPLIFEPENAHRVRLVILDRFGNPLAGSSVLADPANCHVDRPDLRLDQQGAADVWVAAGAMVDQPCLLSVLSLAGWEGNPPSAQFVIGGGLVDVRDFVWDDSLSSQTRVLAFPVTGDWEGFETGYFRGGLDEGVSLPLSESTQEGLCTNRAVCTQAELVYLGTYEGLLPSPRVLCGAGQECQRLLLTKVGSRVSVQVPREHVRTPGRFGMRLVTPGQPETSSAILPFWARVTPFGRQRRVQVSLPAPWRWGVTATNSSSVTKSVHAQRFDDGRVRMDSCGLGSENGRDITAWVATSTSPAPSAQRMTEVPAQAQALSIGVSGYQAARDVSTRMCVPDDVNGDGVQDLIIYGKPSGNLHGRNCVHLVVGHEQDGYVRQANDLAGYCGTIPECSVRQVGERETAIAVIDWCDPDFPVNERAHSLSAAGSLVDNTRYFELNFSSIDYREVNGNERLSRVWSLRRLGRLGQGGRFVVTDTATSSHLRHGVLGWDQIDLDGLGWDEVVHYAYNTKNRCENVNAAYRCSLMAQGGAEVHAGSGRQHLYSGHQRLAATSQGGLQTYDLKTGMGLLAASIGEQRGASMNRAGDWYLRQLSIHGRPSYLRLERFGALEVEYPWVNCNAETLEGCPYLHLTSAFWLSDDVYALHIGGQSPHTLRLYHKDQPLEPYSNSISANALGGYGIVWSTQRQEAIVRHHDALALVRMNLNAELDQRLRVELLPEAIRDQNGRNRCALDPQGNFVACYEYNGTALQLWDRQRDVVSEVAIPRQVLSGEGLISAVQFLATGGLLVSLHRNVERVANYRTTLILDPATQQVQSSSHAIGHNAGAGFVMQARTAWQPPVYGQHYTSQSFGALGYEGDLVWNGSQYSYRLDLTGRQADELTHQHLPGVYRQKIAFDDGQSESMVLNTVDGWIIWTPQRAVPLCGNGILDQGERCDDGNLRHDDDCPMDCRSVCGDGVRSELEACDDGNELDGDGCSAQCELSD